MESQRTPSARKVQGGGPPFPRVPTLIVSSLGIIWLMAVATSQRGQALRETPLGLWMAFRSDPFDLRSFLTHHLFHENWLHLVVNMVCVWFAGRTLEARWGPLRFSAFYLASALAGGLTAYLTGRILAQGVPAGQAAPVVVSLGASAAALACLAAYTLEARERPVLGYLTERYLLWTGAILGSTALVALEQTPHLSGIAAGAAFHSLLPFWERSQARWAEKKSLEHQERSQEIRLRVDQLLEKISRDGLGSLSREEQTFLRDASKHFRNRS